MASSEPRQYTTNEVAEKFLGYIQHLVDYWDKEERAPTAREKLHGLAFSILVALDGDMMILPKFIVLPDPHPDDKAHYRAQGVNWYPECPFLMGEGEGGLMAGHQGAVGVDAARSILGRYCVAR